MQIFEGARRTVRYFGENLSPSEMTMLRDMERLENEMAYTRDLGALKRQYVYSERLVEPYRRLVQQYLYGLNTTQSTYGGFGFGGGGWGNGLVFGGVPIRSGVFGGPFGVAGPIGGLFGGRDTTVNRSLANGMGDQGPMLNSMAPVIASQSSPEYAASVGQAYDRVVMQASEAPKLRVAMGLPEAKAGLAAGMSSGPYRVTLKDGRTFAGAKLAEDDKWVTLTDDEGNYVRWRPSEVVGVEFKGRIKR
jgi:hypothetical protein